MRNIYLHNEMKFNDHIPSVKHSSYQDVNNKCISVLLLVFG